MGVLPPVARVFVVGVPRSGTTLVQSLLATHGAVTSFTESHLFSRHFRHLPLLTTPVLASDPRPRLRQFLIENGIDEHAADRLVSHGGLRMPGHRLLMPLRTHAVARRLLDIVDGLATGRRRAVWIEKTPLHLHYIPFLEALGKAAAVRTRFVHVIRDGMDVVASMFVASKQWSTEPYALARGPVPPYDLDTCVRRWNRDLQVSISRLGSPADDFVFYDELTRQPEAALASVLAPLGLSWEPAMLDRYAQTSDTLTAPNEAWKAVGSRLRPSSTADQALTADDRARVAGALRHDLYARLRERAAGRRGSTGA